MLLGEIIKTCSHEKVAQAAVSSIGTEFQHRVERAARERGLRTGVFVASVVRHFGRTAGDDEWADLARAMERKDMPILSGLRHIVEMTLAGQVPARRRGGAYSRTPTGAAAPASACGISCEA
jgi:hypothetical protein